MRRGCFARIEHTRQTSFHEAVPQFAFSYNDNAGSASDLEKFETGRRRCELEEESETDLEYTDEDSLQRKRVSNEPMML